MAYFTETTLEMSNQFTESPLIEMNVSASSHAYGHNNVDSGHGPKDSGNDSNSSDQEAIPSQNSADSQIGLRPFENLTQGQPKLLESSTVEKKEKFKAPSPLLDILFDWIEQKEKEEQLKRDHRAAEGKEKIKTTRKSLLGPRIAQRKILDEVHRKAKEMTQKLTSTNKALETPEEVSREEEIQRKIRESVMVVDLFKELVMLTEDPLKRIENIEMLDALQEILKTLVSNTFCKLCGLRMVGPRTSLLHFSGQSHLQEVLTFFQINFRSTGFNKESLDGAEESTSLHKKTLEAEVLFIMNRLTPTNFERLAEEMKKLNISTYDDLIQVVNIFFDKATMETKFVEAYAQLCKIMSPFKVPPPPNMKENQCSFRVVMLTKCQQEFEQDKSIIFENPDEKKKKLEAENPEVTPERNEMIENVLYKLKLRRMGFYGNIRFIGELFKLNMLTEKIMHDCIFRLLRARNDDSLVSLCLLLTTVGKKLDTEKAKQRMDQYFTQMSKIVEEHKSTIKFTLMDVIDLRRNHWIPRKETVGPKKIADVHKDFAQEQAGAQFFLTQLLPSRNDTPQQPGSRRGSRQRQDDKINDDGWNSVGSKNIRMIDASKTKISKSNIVDDNIQLGPGGGMNKQPMSSRGSHWRTQMSQDGRSSAPGNRFSALRNDEDRRPFQRSLSRGDGGPASRGMRQGLTVGHGRDKIISRSSTEGERRDALASARSILGGGRSQNSSRDNSWNRDDRRMFGPRSSGEREDTSRDVLLHPNNDMRAPPAPPPAKRAPDLTTDEMESKAKNIFQDYLNIRDLDEAKLCVQELTGQQLLHVLVSCSINDVLEQNDQARTNTGQYLYELLQAKLITMECYLKGLGEVLKFAEDMIIDIPKLWTYLAQTIAPILIGGFLTLSQVKTSVATYLSNRNGAILMSHIISLFAEKAGEEKVAKEASGLGWETFLEADEVETFLEDKKVGFLLRPSSASRAPATARPLSGVSMEQIAADLENLMRKNASNLDLTAFIERLPACENKEKNIVRALMTAIGNASRPDFKSAEEVIKKRKDPLSKVIGTKMDLQLQALYSIQALMTQLEHPRDVMDRFFTALYEEDVIELEAFGRWHKSNDPQEQHGKAVSVLQLKQFFTDLKEDGLILS